MLDEVTLRWLDMSRAAMLEDRGKEDMEQDESIWRLLKGSSKKKRLSWRPKPTERWSYISRDLLVERKFR